MKEEIRIQLKVYNIPFLLRGVIKKGNLNARSRQGVRSNVCIIVIIGNIIFIRRGKNYYSWNYHIYLFYS